MKKNILLIIIAFAFFSCKKQPFFSNFDEVVYFRLKDEILINHKTKDSISKKVFFEDYPSELSDNLFYEKLKLNYYSNKSFSESDVANFKDIFNDKTFTDQYTTACIPEFRDILILKKDKKTVGIVKICIECEMNFIIGKNEKGLEISNSGGLKIVELEKLISKYK